MTRLEALAHRATADDVTFSLGYRDGSQSDLRIGSLTILTQSAGQTLAESVALVEALRTACERTLEHLRGVPDRRAARAVNAANALVDAVPFGTLPAPLRVSRPVQHIAVTAPVLADGEDVA